MLTELRDILRTQALTPLYQPIVDLGSGQIFGYEGLIRGPSNSPLHSPLTLFKCAKMHGMTAEAERVCRNVLLKQFVKLQLHGKLFLNVSPDVLTKPRRDVRADMHQLDIAEFTATNVVLELTESDATVDYAALCEAAAHYRSFGLNIAIDDLGEGFSSLRLWSEVRPEYVKIDLHFIQGIDADPLKLQFVRSILEIAQKSNAMVIAEGIETESELHAVRELGISFGQGYFLGRPTGTPGRALAPSALALFAKSPVKTGTRSTTYQNRSKKVGDLLREVPTVTSETPANTVYEMFIDRPSLQVVPVVDHGMPVGLINRYKMTDNFSRPFQRELYGKKGCSRFCEPTPLIVDHQTSLQDLSHLIVESDPQHLSNGYIITDAGTYIGVGGGHDLIRELTKIQMQAARYANPLTGLPGNVPINEHIELLLGAENKFIICYCDLDNFKAFNDLYGYQKGDEIIGLTAEVLKNELSNTLDFVGHIGGDDFILLFQSSDWEERCRRMLHSFAKSSQRFYRDEHLRDGGYATENRQGIKTFVSLVSLSIGAVCIKPMQGVTNYHVAEAASAAKTQAKKLAGNALFVERREISSNVSPHADN
ncbi:GGDEF domain-containing protein [Noviherbaspirillum pedocola]|uniref:GGDEF domain-containing protein n=1 Tax=Noviherbaspirillum pedocola TaxID=2801341 RepID=A0A934SWW7_9BURK|nr:GGDEF domain-containing protein [Noviherbaspirillum pedocola]MBK4737257.1 GGDEF domain-containing protein [Noviherbaspirillum pedocola]